jgi:hypothetical protein
MTRKILRGAIIAVALLASALSPGCGDDACEVLLDTCIRCADSNIRASCTSVVQQDRSETCDSVIETFAFTCP